MSGAPKHIPAALAAVGAGALLLATVMLGSVPAAATSVTYSPIPPSIAPVNPSNPTDTSTQNTVEFANKLPQQTDINHTILIEQRELPPTAATQGAKYDDGTTGTASNHFCRVVTNNSNQQFFVPWRTWAEWSDFITAATPLNNNPTPFQQSVAVSGQGSCCAPVYMSPCNGDTPQYLGFRTLGIGTKTDTDPTTSGDLPLSEQQGYAQPPDGSSSSFTQYPFPSLSDLNKHWGIVGDVYGPVYGGQSSGGDLETTYQCVTDKSDPTNPTGKWLLTHHVGSCTPLAGQCASVNALTGPPPDLQTLCGTGSIFDTGIGFITTNNGATFTWQCDGTPNYLTYVGGTACPNGTVLNPITGACNITCDAQNESGACGSANNSVVTTAPSSNLCANSGYSPVVLDSKGVANGPTGPWTWQCGLLTSPTICYAYPQINCGSLLAGAPSSTWSNGSSGGTCTGCLDFTATNVLYAANTSDPTNLFCAKGGSVAYGVNLQATKTTGTWTCTAYGGNSTQVCSVWNTNVQGVCGTASGTSAPTLATLSASPSPQLCSSFTGHNDAFAPSASITVQEIIDPASTGVDAKGNLIPVGSQFQWKCEGLSGAYPNTLSNPYNESALCTAPYNPSATAGQCGNTASFSTIPKNCTAGAQGGTGAGQCSLCATGTTLDGLVLLQGTTYTWYCDGANGGTSAACSAGDAGSIPGQCTPGSVPGSTYLWSLTQGQAYNWTASGAMCLYGTPSPSPPNADTVNYDWSWTCQGDKGTQPVSCDIEMLGTCGAAASTTPVSAAPSGAANLCVVGVPVSSANGGASITTAKTDSSGNYYNWWCSADGSPVQCEVPIATSGAACNPAAEVNSTTAPTLSLCTVGASSGLWPVSNGWTWTCTSGSSTVACKATNPNAKGATCGNDTTLSFSTAPTASSCSNSPNCLCSDGSTPGVVINSSSTEWTWTCGTSNACAATAAKTNGQCGFDNGLYIPNNPTDPNLCSLGAAVPDPPTGSGPWTWICSGLGGGGNSPPCTAQPTQACKGTVTNNVSGSHVVNLGLPQGCSSVTVNSTWTETDTLQGGGSASVYALNYSETLQGVARSNLSYSNISTSVPVATPPYETPCSAVFSSLSNFQESILSTTGTGCPKTVTGSITGSTHVP